MKKIFILSFILICITQACAQDFEKYFEPKTLRIDLTFAGNKDHQTVYLSALYEEPIWSGSQKNLIDKFNYGEYRIEVLDSANTKIFAYGFSSLFLEWRTTEEAKTISRAMNNAVWIPFPKHKIKVKILERNKSTNEFEQLSEIEINPKSKQIQRNLPNDFAVYKIQYSGNPSEKVDIAFVAEGYTKNEMQKFRDDVARHAEYLFSIEPYKSRRSDFNIWAVESISEDSGTDIPGENIWKRTAANSTFNTFEIDRYLTAPNHSTVADLVCNVPHDQIYVIVNTKKYGGCGIYNFYALGASDCRDALPVFVHELGHSFAGLGDEYYTSDVAYQDFYNTKLEPWEPNISSLVNFESKWKDMIDASTPIPTPATDEYKEKIGAFEGAGYMAKGMYRPRYNCRMITNHSKDFCAVCQRAISRVIDWHTK